MKTMQLQNSILLLGVVLFAACSSHSAVIDNKVARIEEVQTEYEVVSQDLFGQSTEGGELTFYYQKDPRELKKIDRTLYGEMGKSETQFFYEEGKLIYIAEKTTNYTVPMYDESFDPSTSQVEEEKFYFSGDNMFLWIDPKGDWVDSKAPEVEVREDEWLAESEELIDLQR